MVAEWRRPGPKRCDSDGARRRAPDGLRCRCLDCHGALWGKSFVGIDTRSAGKGDDSGGVCIAARSRSPSAPYAARSPVEDCRRSGASRWPDSLERCIGPSVELFQDLGSSEKQEIKGRLPDSSYRRPADFCWAFFCRRGKRDLFFGGSFPVFTDFVDGLTPASEFSPPKTDAADPFLSAISFRFAK